MAAWEANRGPCGKQKSAQSGDIMSWIRILGMENVRGLFFWHSEHVFFRWIFFFLGRQGKVMKKEQTQNIGKSSWLQIWALEHLGYGGNRKFGQWKRIDFGIDMGSNPGLLLIRCVHLGSMSSEVWLPKFNLKMGMLTLILKYFLRRKWGNICKLWYAMNNRYHSMKLFFETVFHLYVVGQPQEIWPSMKATARNAQWPGGLSIQNYNQRPKGPKEPCFKRS